MTQIKGPQAPAPDGALAAMILQGHTVLRVENDIQQQISVQRPRDERTVLDKLVFELEMSPKFAEKVFYSIEFKNNAKGTKEYVEGISIKGAMAIQRRWGNCASAARVTEEVDDRIVCEGVFMDYETNSRVMRQVAVSRFYKERDTHKLLPLRADMLEKAVHAGMSKAVRNAVNNGVPEWLKMEFFLAAKRVAGSVRTPEGKLVKKTLAVRWEELKAAYELQGVNQAELERLAGKAAIKEADYERLLGTLNALEDGYITKAQLFTEPPPVAPEAKPEIKLTDVIPK